MPATTTSRWILLVAVLFLVRLVAVGVLLNSDVEDEGSILGGDGRRYEAIANDPGTPYEDREVEYPPGSLVVIDLVVGHDTLDTLTRLAVSQLLLEAGIAAVLAWSWGGRTAIAYLVLGTPMILFPFPYARIDLFSVFLTVVAVALLRRRRDGWAGASLAGAIFIKLWPFAVVPLPFVERRRRAAVTMGCLAALGLALWVGLYGTAGISQVTSFRGARGWQIESLPGAVLHMLDPSASHVEQGAWRTRTEVASWMRAVLTAAGVGTVGLSWWLADRRRSVTTPPRLARSDAGPDEVTGALAPLAATLGLLVFSPIISPQYVLWFLPFVAILAVRGHRTLGWLALAVSVLTTFILATIHAQVEGRLYATVPILVRNGLLVVMLVVALRELSAPLTAGHRAEPVTEPRAGTTPD